MDEVVSHTFGIQKLLKYFQEFDDIQLQSNVMPNDLISFECLFDSKYVQRAKMLATKLRRARSRT